MKVTDEELTGMIIKGDKDKFREIVERYEKTLSRYIKNLINQKDEEAEDIVQEVFINAYQNLEGFDRKKNFSSWIYRIAHNKAIDFFKKKRFGKREQIEDQEERLPNREKLLEDLQIEEEVKKEVREAINKLSAEHKEIILLYYYEEKSYEEISEILRIPVSRAGVMLFRARKSLKDKLKRNQNRFPLLPDKGVVEAVKKLLPIYKNEK